MSDQLDKKTYEEIKAYTLPRMAGVGDITHNDEHVLRVEKNASKIVEILKLGDKIDEDILKTACLLHDFLYTVRKPGVFTYIFEGFMVKKIAISVLEKFDVKENVKKTITDAIALHSHSFPFRDLNRNQNVYTKVLQDADTLDFFDCLRIDLYLESRDKGVFGGLKKFVAGKLTRYGMANLGKFLNYPILAKIFVAEGNMVCIPRT